VKNCCNISPQHEMVVSPPFAHWSLTFVVTIVLYCFIILVVNNLNSIQIKHNDDLKMIQTYVAIRGWWIHDYDTIRNGIIWMCVHLTFCGKNQKEGIQLWLINFHYNNKIKTISIITLRKFDECMHYFLEEKAQDKDNKNIQIHQELKVGCNLRICGHV
jgi:hypothetical protein